MRLGARALALFAVAASSLGLDAPVGEAEAAEARFGPARRVWTGVASWRLGPSGAGLQAEPASHVVAWDAGWAEGFVGLVHGGLEVDGGGWTVVLPHGTVTGHPGATFRVAARLDGYATVDVLAGAVDYQGDGGGAGVLRAGAGSLRLGPDGSFQRTPAPSRLPPATSVEAAERLLFRLRGSTSKRSFKLAALEKRQLGLRNREAEADEERFARRVFDLRARMAVAWAWATLMDQSFQPLASKLVASDDALFEALERARRAIDVAR